MRASVTLSACRTGWLTDAPGISACAGPLPPASSPSNPRPVPPVPPRPHTSTHPRLLPSSPRIIDVRTAGEYAGGHVAGALHASFLPPWAWPGRWGRGGAAGPRVASCWGTRG